MPQVSCARWSSFQDSAGSLSGCRTTRVDSTSVDPTDDDDDDDDDDDV